MIPIQTLKDRSVHTYVIWLIGYLIGFIIAWNAPLQSGGYFFPPSFVGLLISSLVPVIVSLLLSRFRIMALLLIAISLNGFLLGFSSGTYTAIYNGQVPIARIVYLLSQSCASLCVLLIGSTLPYRNRYYFKNFSVVCLISICMICFLHYLILKKGQLWICWI